MDDRKWILGYDDSKGSGCLCGLYEMSRKLNGRRKHCGINVTIVPTWTAVMKRRKRSQSSVERFGLAAGSI